MPGVQGAGRGATQAVKGSGGGRRGYTGRQGFRGREEGLHRPSGVQGAGGGATQAVRGSGGGRRGYTGRQEFRYSGPRTGGGATQATRGSGDGRTVTTGRQVFRGRENREHRSSVVEGAGGAVPRAMGCSNIDLRF